jgi:hypothetical protein
MSFRDRNHNLDDQVTSFEIPYGKRSMGTKEDVLGMLLVLALPDNEMLNFRKQ